MISYGRRRLRYLYLNRNYVSELCPKNPSQDFFGSSRSLAKFTPFDSFPLAYNFIHCVNFGTELKILRQTLIKTSRESHSDALTFRCVPRRLFSSGRGNRISRSFRMRKKSKANSKPPLNEARFHRAVSTLPPRFGPEELCSILTLERDPVVCLELYNWASQQPRFRHDVSTYHITIKKLGAAKFYQEMDDVVNDVLAIRHYGSEALYNTMVYYFTEARKLTRAVNIYKHMKNSKNLELRPSIRTYNLLFAAFLSKGSNSYVNYMYMGTISSLFKQMVNDGIEPDIFSLNAVIKGYVLSLHVNEALRIFHQMGVVYTTLPNSHSYSYLIHGLCAQGRTNNAIELCDQMKEKGFVASNKAYNSLVNALALNGEVDKAVDALWEMAANWRPADLITYRTVLDEICRRGRVGEAMKLLKDFKEKDLVDTHTYAKLQHVFGDDYEKF